jgi:hypothetical protein
MTVQKEGEEDMPKLSFRERFQDWTDYLWNRLGGGDYDKDDDYDDDVDDDDNYDGYQEPGSRLRKFDRDVIPRSQPKKREVEEEALRQENHKRQRQTEPEEEEYVD